MDKIFEFLSKYNWKHWLTVILLALAALVSSFFLSSCGTATKVQGNRKVEKTIIHEQQYEIGKNSSTVFTSRSTYQTVKKRS